MTLKASYRFSFTDLHKCAVREANYRRYVYMKRVESGKMTRAQADSEIDKMAEIAELLRDVTESDRLL